MKDAKSIITPLLLVLLALYGCSDSDTCVCPDQDASDLIDDLTADLPGFNSVVLTWTAPSGALEYDIRYSTSMIDADNWALATEVDNEPIPKTAGEREILKIEGLESNTDFYLAIKFRLDSTEWSDLSNVASCYTSVYDARNKIAFHSNLDGDYEIFTVNPDGTELTQITLNNAHDGVFSWISNGQGFVVYSEIEGLGQLFTMDYKGESIINISNNSHFDRLPDVLHPSNRIVFITEEGADTQNNIMTMDVVGTNRSFVTNSTDLDLYPKWSPDGQKILFARFSTTGGQHGTYVIDATGSNLTFLTEGGDNPSWSPDGSQIIYAGHDGHDKEIFIADADGSNPVNISNSDFDDDMPDWSPDGTKIVFVSNRDGDNEIFVMDIDGSNVRQITHNGHNDNAPSWSPVY